MIISDNPKFIFIHIPKAAGQSVTNALMPYAATTYQKILSPVLPYRYQLKLLTQLDRRCNLQLRPTPFSSHVKASIIESAIGPEEFKTYFSFSFVRNPWSLLFSSYNYAYKNKRHGWNRLVRDFDCFSDFACWHCSKYKGQQRDFLVSGNGEKIIDFAGRTENIEADFDHICSKIGIHATLPTLNAYSTGVNYRKAYSDRARDMVSERSKDDIREFGYTF